MHQYIAFQFPLRKKPPKLTLSSIVRTAVQSEVEYWTTGLFYCTVYFIQLQRYLRFDYLVISPVGLYVIDKIIINLNAEQYATQRRMAKESKNAANYAFNGCLIRDSRKLLNLKLRRQETGYYRRPLQDFACYKLVPNTWDVFSVTRNIRQNGVEFISEDN